MDTGMRLGGNFQGTVFKKERETGGYTPRFPFGLDMRRVVPDLANKPFRMTVPEDNKPIGPVKYKVAFFTGCSSNYLYPNVARSFMNVMKRNNVEVIVPKKQHCCGMPVLAHGDQKTAKEMAADHVKLFKMLDVDYIVFVCGSCALSFKEHYPELLEDTNLYEDAKRVAAKVIDWSDFIINVVKADVSGLHTTRQVVTYHDPCHLRRGMGVWQEPRKILNDLPDVEFRMKCPSQTAAAVPQAPSASPTTTFPWTFSMKNAKTSKTPAPMSSLPAGGSCMMQLTDGQKRFDGHCKVKHTVEILSEAYENAEREERIGRMKAIAK